jgi:putative hydrolase of the HAD superfamily
VRSLRHVQALTFDVGGTFIEPWPSVGHVYAEVAARHGHKDVRPERLNQQFAAAWRNKVNFDHSPGSWLELVRETFKGSISRPEEFFEELYSRFARPEAWRIFEDARPALELLRERGFQLGVISNWDERLRPLLEHLELARYFEAIVISVETGFAKPSPRIFDKAAVLLGLPPRFILHVGDSVPEDVNGARAAGFQALLLDRKAMSSAVASTTATLTELVPLLTGNAAQQQ